MKGAIVRVLAVCVLGAIASGCPVVHPQPWDKFRDGEVLRVHGATYDSPGPVVFRSLLEQPKLRHVFDREGVPDTLEILGGKTSSKTIIVKYTRPSAGPPRSITLVPAKDGFVAEAPEPLPRERHTPEPGAQPTRRRPAAKPSPFGEVIPTPAPTTRRPPGTAPSAPAAAAPGGEIETNAPPAPGEVKPDASSTKPASGKRPTAEQALGCPIDPDRPDCQAFCVPGADHEWCR